MEFEPLTFTLDLAHTDDCVFAFAVHGATSPSLTNCFVKIGDKFSLWERHPLWRNSSYIKVK